MECSLRVVWRFCAGREQIPCLRHACRLLESSTDCKKKKKRFYSCWKLCNKVSSTVRESRTTSASEATAPAQGFTSKYFKVIYSTESLLSAVVKSITLKGPLVQTTHDDWLRRRAEVTVVQQLCHPLSRYHDTISAPFHWFADIVDMSLCWLWFTCCKTTIPARPAILTHLYCIRKK